MNFKQFKQLVESTTQQIHIQLNSLVPNTNRREVVVITSVIDEDTLFSGNRLIRKGDYDENLKPFKHWADDNSFHYLDGSLVEM
jgi:hypothetical protein